MTLLLVLTIPIGLLLVLGGSAWFLARQGRRRVTVGALMAIVIGGSAFVLLGVGAVNTITDGRGAPGETAPWLVLIALVGGGLLLHRLSRAAPGDVPAARAPSAVPRASAPVAPAVFLSYRRSDSADVTGRLYDRLAAHFGPSRVFKDVDSIPLGLDFRTQIADAVGQCRVVLAIVGPRWRGADAATGADRLSDPRDIVRVEIESAIERGIPVIPVRVQGADLPAPDTLPAGLQDLAYRNAIQVRSDPDFHVDVDRLIKGIESHIAAAG